MWKSGLKAGCLAIACAIAFCAMSACSAEGSDSSDDKYERAFQESQKNVEMWEDSLEDSIWDLLPVNLASIVLSSHPEFEDGSFKYSMDKHASDFPSDPVLTASGSFSVYKASVGKISGKFKATYDYEASPKWAIDISWDD